jgi:O-antigen/teichoic acid export membrane protein
VDRSGGFARGFAVTFGFDVVARALSAATVVVLVRGFSVRDYAFITLFFTVGQLMASAAGAGVRVRYLREEAERVSRGTAGTTPTFVAALLNGNTMILAFGAVVLAAVQLFELSGNPQSDTELVLLATLFAVGLASVELTMFHYQAQQRFAVAGVINAGRAALLLAVGALLVAGPSATQKSAGAWFSLGLLAFAALTVLTVGGARWRQLFRRRSRLPLSLEERWLSLYYFAAAGVAYVDVLLAGFLLDARDVASLGAARRYLAVVLGVLPALTAVMRVRTSQRDIVDRAENQRRMLTLWIGRTALPAAALTGVLAGVADVLIPHIDEGKYPTSITVFQVLLVTAFVSYVTLPTVSIIMARREFRLLALVALVTLVAQTVGIAIVAPFFGIVGIAVVSGAAYSGQLGMLTVIALRRTKPTSPDAGRAAQPKAGKTSASVFPRRKPSW